MLLTEITSRAKLDEKNLIAVYPYGSRVYGTFRKHSDYDFIVIVKTKTNEQFSDELININFFTETEHQQRLDDHEISALECHFLNDDQIILQKRKFKFTLNLVKLRHSLSKKSSNSWVKAKKKLTVEKDFNKDLGRKSLFHSFRIIDYGKQIAQYGKIKNYSNCNDVYHQIMDSYTFYSWETLFDKFKESYNQTNTEFRILAPKK